MTIKEVMKIAEHEDLLLMLNLISEGMKNDYSRTEYEKQAAAKARKDMAKRLIEKLKKI